MIEKTSFLTSKLFEKDFISKEQLDDFKEYKAKNIFSLNTELLFLMYASVLLFTSGIILERIKLARVDLSRFFYNSVN